MRRRRVSVPTVVAVTLVIVTTILLGSFGTGTYIRDVDHDRAELVRLTNTATDNLAAALALPVWNIDRAQIDKILEAMEAARTVEAIAIDAAGRTQARVRNARGAFVPSDGNVPRAGLVVAERAITFDGDRIGTVRLYATTKYIDEDARLALWRTLGTIFVLDVLLVLAVYLLLWITVLQPLGEIEAYALAVTSGEPHAPLELSHLTSDLETLRATIERMVQLQESLRRSETMSVLGNLVGGVAHEIRNPLFAISATLDAYAQELSDPAFEEFRDALRQQVVHLTSLARELLEYGRPVTLAPVTDSIAALLQDVATKHTSQAATHGVAIRASIDSGLPRISMDRNRMRQAFDNLVQNAIQHSPEGGVVTISATPATHDGNHWVDCTVEDDGPGFAKDELPRLFEPFFSRRPGGIGLGLSIVQRVVDEHGGSVVASNRTPRGASMTVRLPV